MTEWNAFQSMVYLMTGGFVFGIAWHYFSLQFFLVLRWFEKLCS